MLPCCTRTLIALTISLTGCTFYGPRDVVEGLARAQIGKTPEDAFRGSKILAGCYERAGEYGCMEIDIRDCRIWYRVDRTSNRIVTWEYAGAKEKCQTFHGA